MDSVEFGMHYRTGAGEIAGGGCCAGGRAEVGWTDARGVLEELVQLGVVHLESDNGGHSISAVFTDHQWSAGRHHRAAVLELTAAYNFTGTLNNCPLW